jgi:hypothetical protein
MVAMGPTSQVKDWLEKPEVEGCVVDFNGTLGIATAADSG